jgi:hypothetical protein
LEGALVDGFVCETLLGGPDVVVEPDVERLVVAEAAEEGHGGVGMHVAKTGEDMKIGAIFM